MKALHKLFLQLLRKPSLHLLTAILIANVVNMLFNAYVGRVLSLSDFAALTWLLSIDYIAIIIFNGVGSAVNQRTAFLSSRLDTSEQFAFAAFVRRKIMLAAALATLVWCISIPLLQTFFQIQDTLLLVAFAPLIIPGFLLAINRGFLQGNIQFHAVAVIVLIESIVRFVLTVLFVMLGLTPYIYATIPFSVLTALGISQFFIQQKKYQVTHTHKFQFPFAFIGASIVTGLSSMAYLTFDIMLVKHFLSPNDAGVYSLLALVGKMIYFFGSLINTFTITYISREEGASRNPHAMFYKLFAGVLVTSSIGFIGLGLFGSWFVPLLFGSKALAISPYLFSYSLAIVLLTLGGSIVSFHLARKQYLFSFLSLISAVVMVVGITLFHRSIQEITQVILFSAALNLTLLTFFHINRRSGKFFVRNLVDLFGVFFPLPAIEKHVQKRRILIFNWRDTKHRFAGGAEVYIHELAKRWVREGHQVTLFCSNDSHCPRYEKIDGVDIIRRGGFYTVYVWAFVYYLFRFRRQYDVIIDSQNGIPFFTPLYAREKIVCLMHHVHQEVFFRTLSWPLSWIAATLENKCMPYVYKQTKFIAVSNSTKKEMEKIGLGFAGIEIVHPGISLEHFIPGKKDETPMVLYLGRLKKYKGIYEFANIVAELRRHIPEIKVVIAGDGEERDPITNLLKSLKLWDSIEFLGKVTESEKVRLYQKAWVYVNPSFVEGWGITSIEANACGTPVVASRVPGLQDSVKNPHTGYLVPYGDIASFTEKIKELIHNHRIRKTMEKEAVRWAKKFDWRISAQKGLKVIST